MSGTPMPCEYIEAEAKAGRMGARLMAIVAEGDRGRVYLSPTPEMEAVALKAKPAWKPDVDLPVKALGLPRAGIRHDDVARPLHPPPARGADDLLRLGAGSARAGAARRLAAGLADDGKPLRDGGTGATAYARCRSASTWHCAVDKVADDCSTICYVAAQAMRPARRSTFARQAIPMVWDYRGGKSVRWSRREHSTAAARDWSRQCEVLPASRRGWASQADACRSDRSRTDKVVSTDPPYYDNIGYADLSDFFYVWLRRSLKPVFPDLFATLAVPKAEELVATPYRHGSKEKAEAFFLDGMTRAMHRLAEQAHPAFPVTIYYAFKQSESDDEEAPPALDGRRFSMR